VADPRARGEKKKKGGVVSFFGLLLLTKEREVSHPPPKKKKKITFVLFNFGADVKLRREKKKKSSTSWSREGEKGGYATTSEFRGLEGEGDGTYEPFLRSADRKRGRTGLSLVWVVEEKGRSFFWADVHVGGKKEDPTLRQRGRRRKHQVHDEFSQQGKKRKENERSGCTPPKKGVSLLASFSVGRKGKRRQGPLRGRQRAKERREPVRALL